MLERNMIFVVCDEEKLLYRDLDKLVFYVGKLFLFLNNVNNVS